MVYKVDTWYKDKILRACIIQSEICEEELPHHETLSSLLSSFHIPMRLNYPNYQQKQIKNNLSFHLRKLMKKDIFLLEPSQHRSMEMQTFFRKYLDMHGLNLHYTRTPNTTE